MSRLLVPAGAPHESKNCKNALLHLVFSFLQPETRCPGAMKRHILLVTLVSALMLTAACGDTAEQGVELPELPYNLIVAPGQDTTVGNYIIAQGIEPAQGELPARPFAAALYCYGTWSWPNQQQMREYQVFRSWLTTSPAEGDNSGLRYEDISITCDNADTTIQFKSSEFRKTLALLPSGASGSNILARGEGMTADVIRFPAAGVDSFGVRITETEVEPVVGSTGTGGTILARQGSNTVTLWPGGTEGFTYDPAQPVEIAAQRPAPDSLWDLLTVSYNEGAFTWKKTPGKPF